MMVARTSTLILMAIAVPGPPLGLGQSAIGAGNARVDHFNLKWRSFSFEYEDY